MSGHDLARPPRRASRHRPRPAAARLTLLLAAGVACHDDGATLPTGADALASPLAARTVTSAAVPPWRIVPSPNRGTAENELRGVAVASPTAAWAVGNWNPTGNLGWAPRQTLIERWNGATWQVVPSPNASGANVSTFESVAALSDGTAWAVGYADLYSASPGLRSTTLVARWNGTQWTAVPSPNPSGPDVPNRLYDVVARSANDVWAVGEQGYDVQGYPYKALILHWDGTSWRNVPNSCGYSLYGIAAVGPTTLWAVGDQTTCRYDGRSWTRVAPASAATLTDVSGVTPTQVWAVGYYTYCYPYGGCIAQSRIQRWDGARWTSVPHPLFSQLQGVDAVSTADVWAVGDSAAAAATLHWDGTRWTNVPVPSNGVGSALQAVDALDATRVWAVGLTRDERGAPRTLTIAR